MTTRKLHRILIGLLIALAISVFSQALPPATAQQDDSGLIMCTNPTITDGDTFRCGDLRIRLAGIDAPEMPGHCRKGRDCTPGDPIKAKSFLKELIGESTNCQQINKDHYGRIIARCTARGLDLSCAMVAAGHAVERYGKLSC